MCVKISQGLREGVLHDGGERVQQSAIKALLDQTPLGAPGFSVGSKKTLPQKVAHPFDLNFGFLVVLRVGLQDMLNDGGIGRNDSLFQATQIEPECITEGCGVLRQDVHGISGHGARIREGTKS